MKTILKILATVALVAATVLATAHLTYRTTMQNIRPEVTGNTVTLTVWGQSDTYTLEEAAQ